MPSLTLLSVARIFERVMLQALERKSDACAPAEQAIAIDRDQMRHRTTEPDVPMQPEPAIHRMSHSVAPFLELTPFGQKRGWIRRVWNRREGAPEARVARVAITHSVAGDQTIGRGRRGWRVHGPREHRTGEGIRLRVGDFGRPS